MLIAGALLVQFQEIMSAAAPTAAASASGVWCAVALVLSPCKRRVTVL